MIISIFVVIIFILSFFSGLKQGAVKNFFSLLELLVAIPLTGLYYTRVADWLSFLPGTNWENFIGFYIVLTILTIILRLVLLIPGKILKQIWGKGMVSSLLGAAISLFYAGLAMALFTLVTFTYPIFDWLAKWLAGSGVLMSVVNMFAFLQSMLPDIFQSATRLF